MNTIKKEFTGYLVIGGIAFFVDFIILTILGIFFNIHYLLATLIAFLGGTWINYILSIHYVFNFRNEKNLSIEFGLFLLVGLITLTLSLLVMSFLVNTLAVHILLAKCITTSLTLVTNFIGRRILLFSRAENNYLLVAQFNEIKL